MSAPRFTTDTLIDIPDPDDEHGMPIYSGELKGALDALEHGNYAGIAWPPNWEGPEGEDTVPVNVVLTPDGAFMGGAWDRDFARDFDLPAPPAQGQEIPSGAWVEIDDPEWVIDDSPLYQGKLSRAGVRLMDGNYEGSVRIWSGDEPTLSSDEPGLAVGIVIVDGHASARLVDPYERLDANRIMQLDEQNRVIDPAKSPEGPTSTISYDRVTAPQGPSEPAPPRIEPQSTPATLNKAAAAAQKWFDEHPAPSADDASLDQPGA